LRLDGASPIRWRGRASKLAGASRGCESPAGAAEFLYAASRRP